MVCSIGTPYSKLINYAEENFSNKKEAIENSRWFGHGSKKLGLSGQVNPKSYENIYQGRDDRGNSLRRRLANKNSRPGRDLTFSAPKSVSLLALVEENKLVIDAHDRAVNRALDYIEQNCIYTRIGKGGNTLQQTNNMVTAIFQHHNSRNLDPNLHSHCVIFNQTEGNDGKWRSMENRQLYQQKMTIGAIYHHELSQQLMEQGYSIDWNQNGIFDIAGISRERLEQFSSRRAEIINLVGVESSGKEKAIACISTRNKKKYISLDERKTLKQSWQLKYQATSLKSSLRLKQYDSQRELKSEKRLSTRELIDTSLKTFKQNNQTRFTQAELLKEVLTQSQGRDSLDVIQQEINKHPQILYLKNNHLTTIDLYRQERKILAGDRHRLASSRTEPNVLKLATSVLSSELNLTTSEKELSQEQNTTNRFLIKDIPEQESRIFQTIHDYLESEGYLPQSKSFILTDTEDDRQVLTDQLREKLIEKNELGSYAIHSVILQPKNLNPDNLTRIENYQPGNAIKFKRSSKKFSNQHFYKILSIDEKNKVIKLGDRFGIQVDLPIHRYKNREIFQVEKRELRPNEKLRFERGIYINGQQFSSGQSFIIKDIKDKQRITIEINNKISIVKTDDLFFAQYNYADTLGKYQGKEIDSCIYYPSIAKSDQKFKQDIYEVASLTKAELTVYTSDKLLQQNISLKAKLLQPDMELKEESKAQLIDTSQAINDTLFELASSAKFIALNEGIDSSHSADQKVYHSPDGVMIEKDPQNLSIYYDGKSIEFNQDFDVVKNDFTDQEIRQLNQKTEKTQQQSLEKNRTQQIQRDMDLSL